MGEWGWIVTLMILGAVLELSGLGLVVWEVRSDAERIKAYAQRPITLRIHSSIHAMTSSGTGIISGGREPTVEEKVALLEQANTELRESLNRIPDQLRKEWREDIIDGETRVVEKLKEDHAAIEQLVIDANTKLRAWGVGLFFFGLALQTAASVWSMTRSG